MFALFVVYCVAERVEGDDEEKRCHQFHGVYHLTLLVNLLLLVVSVDDCRYNDLMERYYGT